MSWDVVVVGGGLAGLSAANRAAELGLRVVVLERGTEERYPCNSRFAAGFLNCGYRYDIRESPEVLRRAIHEQTRGAADPALAEVFAANAAESVRWLGEQGARIVSIYVDGDKRRALLAPPPPNRAGLHWPGRGTDVAVRRLIARLLERRGQLHRGTRAVELAMADGRCRGVFAERDGTRIEYAAGAVVLADGGFQADPELLARYITPAPDRLLQRNAKSGRGDGLRMALAVGAAVRGMDKFYGHLHSCDAMTNPRLWPYPVLDTIATAGIVVDAAGRRFTDEGLGAVAIANAIAGRADPLEAVAICDEATWTGRARKFARPANPFLVRAGATIHRADSIAALAAAAGLPADTLAATVDAFNRAIAAGTCASLEPARTDRAIKPVPILKPPFYAFPLCAGITYTMGGIAIDGQCRVLHTGGEPIAGLYAAGSTTGGHEGGPGAGYTGGLGKALIFGRHAGECIATALGAPRRETA